MPDAHRHPPRPRPRAARSTRPSRCFGLYADVQCHRLRATGRSYVGWRRPRSARPPARDLLPPLDRVRPPRCSTASSASSASVDASRGCAHRCRHCPVPVVYDGRVRSIDERRGARRRRAAGRRRRAPHHVRRPRLPQRAAALAPRRARVHERFPDVTFDCTVKVEHVLRHADAVAGVRRRRAACSWCRAFESVDDAVLERLDKGHTAADAGRAVGAPARRTASTSGRRGCRSRRGPRSTTSSRSSTSSHDHDLVGSVDPVQYTSACSSPRARCCSAIPTSSPHLGPWDDERSTYTWRRPTRRSTSCSSGSPRSSRRTATRATSTRRPRRSRRAARRPHAGHHRSPAPHRELVLLRRAHRPPAVRASEVSSEGAASAGAAPRLHVLAPVQARARTHVRARPAA